MHWANSSKPLEVKAAWLSPLLSLGDDVDLKALRQQNEAHKAQLCSIVTILDTRAEVEKVVGDLEMTDL